MRAPARTTLLLLGGLLAAACGGSGDDEPTGPGASNMSAEIDGDSWRALGSATRGGGGLYSIVGTNANASRTLSIALYNIGGTGTYPLGAGPSVFGGTGLVSFTSGEGWATPLTGTAGSITITTLTSERIAGTFAFTSTPLTGGASGDVEVTDGEFDMLVGGVALTPLAENAGSRLTATVDGTPFVGGTVAIAVASGITVMNGNNVSELLSFTLSQVSTTGTYALSTTAPARTITFNGDVTSVTAPIWGNQPADSGSVIITRFDADRVTGTFTAWLHPFSAAAAGTLQVTGAFDYGRPHAP